MKAYALEKHWQLLFTRGAVKGKQGIVSLRVLIDTGSTYTIFPVEVLESIGYSPTKSKDRVRIITASGAIIAPMIRVAWVHLFGKKLPGFPIVAYTLPTGIYADGLVGMDLLKAIKAVLDIDDGVLESKAK